MDTNKEEWKDAAAESSTPQKSEENRTHRNDGSASNEEGRSQRPRIHREYDDRRPTYPKRYSDGYNQGGDRSGSYNRDRNYSRPYDREGGNNSTEGGASEFRPRRPHTDNYSGGDRGGYRPRTDYNSSDNRGYRPRTEQGSGDDRGGYRPRTDYNSGENRGYRPRTEQSSGDDRGGYRPRTDYNSNDDRGGYRPRYQNSGSYGNHNSHQAQGEGGWRGDNRSQGGESGEYRRPSNRSYGDRDRNYSSNSRGYGDRGGHNDGERRPYTPRYGNGGGSGNHYSSGGGYNRSQSEGYNPNAKYSIKKQIEYRETHIDPNEPIRLNKYMANAGICSRREADEFIQAGAVAVNGIVVTELGTKVKRSDEVKFHDELISIERKVYVLLNKPKDFVTTSDDPQGRKTVMDLVKNACRERIYPVGRLDRNTTGVLLLTNDGELASKLTHPKFLKKKVYQVTTDSSVNKEDLDKIATGITLEDGVIEVDAVGYSDDSDKRQVGIEIHSGKNRIVRRIFESLGYRVLRLDRVLFAGLTKKSLRRGDWRYLTETEVNMLRMGAFE